MKLKIKLNQQIFQWLAIVVLGLFIAFSYFNKPKFASFDIKTVTTEFADSLEKQNPNKLEAKVKVFNQALVDVISEYEEDNNTIIFVKGALVSESVDITPIISKKLRIKMVDLE